MEDAKEMRTNQAPTGEAIGEGKSNAARKKTWQPPRVSQLAIRGTEGKVLTDTAEATFIGPS